MSDEPATRGEHSSARRGNESGVSGRAVAAAAGLGNAGLETPALVVDAVQLRSNIADMAARLDRYGVSLRPHFKTSKCHEVTALQAARGAVGFTCATAEEVKSLLQAGHRDVLWAFPPVGQERVELAVEANRSARLLVALDSFEAAAALSVRARERGTEVPVLIEVDTGLHRTGIKAGDAPDFARRLVATCPGLRLAGVMTHEGHLASLAPDTGAVAVAGRAAGQALVSVARRLRDSGYDCPVVSVGSTPGATSAPTVDGVTEARPGTYVFYDANQVAIGSAEIDQCALFVVARVISRPDPQRAVIDAGLKALSSDRSITGAGYGYVQLREPLRLEVAYEEHGVVTGAAVAGLKVGDVVSILPNHACGTVNMWNRMLVAEEGALVGDWRIVARRGEYA